MEIDLAAEPLSHPEEVAAVELRHVLHPGVTGDGEVDCLAAGLRQRGQKWARELDDVALQHPALGHAEDCRARAQPAADPVLLDQAPPFERADEP